MSKFKYELYIVKSSAGFWELKPKSTDLYGVWKYGNNSAENKKNCRLQFEEWWAEIKDPSYDHI